MNPVVPDDMRRFGAPPEATRTRGDAPPDLLHGHDARGEARAALLARWSALTRGVLPGMAARQGWPISRDHCFMRVCLDAAVGARWDAVVRRPAARHLTDAQLAAAVAVAEAVVAAPSRLPALNAASLRLRAGAGRGKTAGRTER